MDTIDTIDVNLIDAARFLSNRYFVTTEAGEELPISPQEALEFIVPILRYHWQTIKAIHDGESKVGLAVVKYDPLIVAVEGLGLMKPANRSYAAIALCFVDKYYPGIVRNMDCADCADCADCEDEGCAGSRSLEKV